MSVLYTRVLLWHKLLAMQTGGLALCSAKHRLNRDEARSWVTAARNVADDIEAFLETGAFILDDRGERVVGLTNSVPVTGSGDSETVGCKSGGLRVARRKTK